MKVSNFIVRFLEELGVEAIFGMPGAHILPVYDGLYDSTIKTVLVKHEQGAAFMAGGYNRATSKIGACITTAGPGATNLVTGIGNAYADSQAVLAITGEAPTYLFGKGGLQESSGEGGSIDQAALFSGITRYHKLIERVDYLVNVLNKATKILLSNKPGPVVLSLPYNIQNEEIDDSLLHQLTIFQNQHTKKSNHHQQSAINTWQQDTVDLLKQVRSPVLMVGYGCILSDAQQAIKTFSSQYNIPVTSSLKAKGVIDELSPLSLGSLGVTSTGYAYDYILNQSDLIIFLGAAFNERTSYVWQQKLLQNKKIIQVDVDSQQLEKVFKADVAIQGDIKQVVKLLNQQCEAQKLAPFTYAKAQEPCKNAIFDEKFDLIKAFYSQLSHHFKQGLTVFDDNIILAQSFFSVAAAHRYYPNSGISSLGHAIPAAIGAGMEAEKDGAIFAILGDGGFQMCCMEIMTAVNYNISLNIVLFNNQTMGLIRKNQHQAYNERFIDCDFINPDFADLAKSFGIDYYKIETETQCETLFSQTDFSQGIRLIEIPVDQQAYPNYSSNR